MTTKQAEILITDSLTLEEADSIQSATISLKLPTKPSDTPQSFRPSLSTSFKPSK